MRAHQRCGLEREWGIVYTDEVLGGDVVLQRPKGYGTGSEEVGARRSLSHSLSTRSGPIRGMGFSVTFA